MCGIFGGVGSGPGLLRDVMQLSNHARQRGADSSGLIFSDLGRFEAYRADFDIQQLRKRVSPLPSRVVAGHSRLVTHGHQDNQPVIRDDIAVIHNGIVVNTESIWATLGSVPRLAIDTEVLPAIAAEVLGGGGQVAEIPGKVLDLCEGICNCAMFIPKSGKLLLFSNNGSLYVGEKNGNTFFSSEMFPLSDIDCSAIERVVDPIVLDIPVVEEPISITDFRRTRINLVPPLPARSAEETLLAIPKREMLRCSRCILPETMPFVSFDESGICNYCRAYIPRNAPRPLAELKKILDGYKRPGERDTILPFSGGRDSSFGLHVAVEVLGLKPITYTYDWGMVTDLGRRNISRMCAALGVENIIVAADIEKKRRNIRHNLQAWLKSPHLGMVSILTAGDKHFFRHVETIKKQTGISLNLWSINPLEVTHFKSGFLGIPPDFEEQSVYSSGISKQLRYHSRRFGAMLQSPGYFNTSLWDTLSGEYYRSAQKKTDYHHLFDYMRWDETEIDSTLSKYSWELAEDTRTTWRIGDGTAALYNYLYFRVAGFTEHDTFRSNQIREGDITREEALEKVDDENQPRYQNIRWYLDALDLDFRETITTINRIRPLGLRGASS